MNDLELRAMYQRLVELRSDADRHRCASPEEIVALAEGVLPEEERVRLLTHVATCMYCQRDLGVVRTVVVTREGDASSRRTSRFVTVAAAAAAAAFVGTMLFSRANRNQEGEVMRGGGTDISAVAVAPIGAVTDSAGPLTFVWHPVPRTTRYDVEVLTDAGALVYATSQTDTSFVIPPSVQLARSTDYLWRISAALETGATTPFPAKRFRIR